MQLRYLRRDGVQSSRGGKEKPGEHASTIPPHSLRGGHEPPAFSLFGVRSSFPGRRSWGLYAWRPQQPKTENRQPTADDRRPTTDGGQSLTPLLTASTL